MLYTLLALFLVPVLFPVYYVFVGAVMEPRELSTFPARLLPTGITTDSIRGALDAVPLMRMYGNAVVMAGVIIACQLATSALAAYAFATSTPRTKDGSRSPAPSRGSTTTPSPTTAPRSPWSPPVR